MKPKKPQVIKCLDCAKSNLPIIDGRCEKCLTKFWYDKVAESGFEDIEDQSCPDIPSYDRPLKEWHSFKFLTEEAQQRKQDQELYNAQVDSFLNHPEFDDICQILTSHGNSILKSEDIRTVWELHCNGATERDIAAKVGVSKNAIHKTLERIKQWMSLV